MNNKNSNRAGRALAAVELAQIELDNAVTALRKLLVGIMAENLELTPKDPSND